ncbi:MAG: 1-deoxy-D-xylulose-5-phosphate synthase N-terminal domain-containing protein [Nitriliruptoraceae bacterium]
MSPPGGCDLATLEAVERRVHWLAVRMVDHANRRPGGAGGIKVGGHQASSTSMVSLMTALWFGHLEANDRVAVKPHASPVFHAIRYLLGELEAEHLTQLRTFGGLQAYPSRTKDPGQVDFSTGSVGLGATAPLFAAMARRYVDAHHGARPANRFVALVGDAELDEGNIWEAIGDAATAGLGNVLWVVDLNRQSLDRVVPGMQAGRLERAFADNGWHVTEAKYGQRLQRVFARDGGDALRRHIDEMSNERYQSLFALQASRRRARFLEGADRAVRRVVDGLSDAEMAVVLDLGGHDLAELLDRFREADAVPGQPSVVFAYTIKGWRTRMAGDPRNHSALLSEDALAEVRVANGLDEDTEWDRFPPDSASGRLCAATAERLERAPWPATPPIRVPPQVSLPRRPEVSTQETFGRLVVALGREEAVRRSLVTVSPDVAISTGLGGWVNAAGVFDPWARPDEAPIDAADGPTLLKWERSEAGQHVELGISEMNLFSALEAFGLSHDHSGQRLLPIGTLYDPFVCRGLDALIHGVYSGARFVIVGTPSGVTLAPEGGAHQSTITASIGVELPGLVLAEPAYATALDWLLCDGLARMADEDGPDEALYLRLTTRPIAQAPFEAVRERLGDDELRRQVLAGAYVLVPATGTGPLVRLVASGAVLPEVVAAQAALTAEGVRAEVLDVTSLTRLYRDWRAHSRRGVRTATEPVAGHLERLLSRQEPRSPLVTVHDAASHAMAWLGSVTGAPLVPLGVDDFGQSGTIGELHQAFELDAGHIVNAALAALARG